MNIKNEAKYDVQLFMRHGNPPVISVRTVGTHTVALNKEMAKKRNDRGIFPFYSPDNMAVVTVDLSDVSVVNIMELNENRIVTPDKSLIVSGGK